MMELAKSPPEMEVEVPEEVTPKVEAVKPLVKVEVPEPRTCKVPEAETVPVGPMEN